MITSKHIKIRQKDGVTTCTFYNTDIVKLTDKEIILNTGGFHTVVTKNKMNKFAIDNDLPYYIAMHNGKLWAYFGKEDVIARELNSEVIWKIV